MAERTVAVRATVRGVRPDTVFDRLRDFSSYAEHADVVREITVGTDADGGQVSNWSVWFRNGLLRWTERDEIDPDTRTLRFEQVSGDLLRFGGAWRVDDAGDAVRVHFDALVDLGIPSLAEMLDPLAERALVTNTTAILRGLFGPDIEFGGPA